jgi:hypothetical protein
MEKRSLSRSRSKLHRFLFRKIKSVIESEIVIKGNTKTDDVKKP